MPRSNLTSSRDARTGLGRRRAETQPLTDIERKILDFMVQYLRANTYQPSIREIGERFGIKSTKTVSEHLQSLADKGYLERDPSRSRGVRILGVDLSAQTMSIPCFNELPADGRSPRAKDADLHLSIDRRLAGERGGFFVRAKAGDLAQLGVTEGDYVLVEPVQMEQVDDGDVVVVRIGDGSWFHRVSHNGRGTLMEALRPGGDATLVEDPESLRILGRVTAFYRRMDESSGALNLTRH
ncbi:MAG: transcriptional repressor LexA [Gemmatimonadota bacterium]